MMMKRKHRVLISLMGFMGVIGLIFPALSYSGPEKVLQIGAIFPLSGRAATWGLAAQKAITIKQKEVNARGGLNVGGERYKIEIVWEDDKATASTARMAAEKLINREKGGII